METGDYFRTWVGVRIPPYGMYEDFAYIIDRDYVLQEENTCWLYAFSRSLNSILRIYWLIHNHAVDLLAFFAIMNRHIHFLPPDLTISNIEFARHALVNTGLALDGRVPYPHPEPLPTRFGVRRMFVIAARDHSLQDFETMLVRVSREYPVVIGTLPFPSLYAHQGDALYRPTQQELNVPPGGQMTHQMTHLMVVTGDGRVGTSYFIQVQDTTRVDNNGFLYVELGVGSICYFVALVDPCMMCNRLH